MKNYQSVFTPLVQFFLLFLIALNPSSPAEAVSQGNDRIEASMEERVQRTRRGSPLVAAVDLQYVPIQYPNYRWNGGQVSTQSGQGAHLGLEWLPFGDLYGKLGLGVGFGVYTIGNVNFPTERTSLTTIPVESFIAYRLDYFHQQLIVPFLKVGLSAAVARQLSSNPWKSYFGFDYSGGVELCLNVFDRSSANDFDASLGVNATYLSFEYLRSQPLTEKNAINLSHDEIRIGLRLEM